MKPIAEMVRETRRAENPSRDRWIHMIVQIECALSLASWLRSLGHELPAFDWSYER